MTVARQLARLMDGDLGYRATDPGSVFTLTLPDAPRFDTVPPSDEMMTVAAGGRPL